MGTVQVGRMFEDEAEISDYERGYLEAAIDGEGCLSLAKIPSKTYVNGFRYTPFIFIAGIDRPFIENCKRIISKVGACSITHYKNKTSVGNSVYRLAVPPGTLRLLLPQISFIIKEQQRLVLLEALKLIEENMHHHIGNFRTRNFNTLEELYLKMRELHPRSFKRLLERKKGRA